MLFMFCAESAVIRTAAVGFDTKRNRHFSGQAIIVPVKPLHVAAHEVFSLTVYSAGFAEIKVATGPGAFRSPAVRAMSAT
jgi:hypothetical protein